MLTLDTHTCDFVAGSVMSIRNYFRPSNRLSESTGSISVALKSRVHGTSNPPCARSAEYFLHPVTVHSIVPLRCKNSEHTPRYLSRQMSHDSYFLFHGSIGNVFGLSFAQRRLFSRGLPYFFIYVIGLNTTIHLENSSIAVTFSIRFFPLL